MLPNMSSCHNMTFYDETIKKPVLKSKTQNDNLQNQHRQVNNASDDSIYDYCKADYEHNVIKKKHP